MSLASVYVNNKPLNGRWDGQNWSKQTARCSNNFGGREPTGDMVQWQIQVYNGDDPNSITFNVSTDREGDDNVINRGLTNGANTKRLPPLNVDSVRGYYIASVRGASAPFHIHVEG